MQAPRVFWGSALCLLALATSAAGSNGSPREKLRNDKVGYALEYPDGWSTTGQVQATEFASRSACQSVRIVDFRPPPTAGPAAQVRQSYVQVCSRRIGGSTSLDEFMRETYGSRLGDFFERTRLAGTDAYRTKGAPENRTFFLQTPEYRLQVVAAVVASPARRAKRLAQVDGILASFQLTR